VRGFAPGVVGIFYHLGSAAVNDGDDVALQVMDQSVARPVVVNHAGSAFSVIEEVEAISALFHMHNLLAVEGVVRHRAIHGFTHAQAVGIVIKGGRGACFVHADQLPACAPCEGPAVVGEGIADIVVGDGIAVIRSQLVLPDRIVSIIDCFQRNIGCYFRVGITRLGEDIPTAVVCKCPGLVGALIVDAGQLP